MISKNSTRRSVTNKRFEISIWVLFTLFSISCISSLVYFHKQSRQLLGADFTALAIDIVQSQIDVIGLKKELDHLIQNSPLFDINRLEQHIIRAEYRIPLIQRKIEASALNQIKYEAIMDALLVSESLLPKAKNYIQAYKNNETQSLLDLIQLLEKVEPRLAWSYSELHNLIQDTSSLEKRITNRLSVMIWGLIFVILLVVSILIVVLMRIYRQKEILMKQTEKDDLTNLYNRRYITENTQKILATNNEQIGFAIIDLDHFKRVNDEFGHPIGDKVLQRISVIISERVPSPGLTARLGGEEFCLLFIGQSKTEIFLICEEIRQAVQNTEIQIDNNRIKLTLSIGLYLREHGENTTFSQIYQFADTALYMAKNNGRNQIHIHKEEKFSYI